MADLYLQEIPLNAETKSYLKAIPSREDAGEKEIEEKEQLFFEKVKEGLKKEYPFLNFNLFKIRLDEERVYIVFKPHPGWYRNEREAVNKLFHLNFDNNEDFRKYCQRQFEEKFGQELQEVVKLKNRINDLEEKLKEEKLKSCKGDFDYTKIQYKNLNDLNSAKFLSDDEKRLICGLLPKSK